MPEIRGTTSKAFQGASAVISRPGGAVDGDLLLLIHSADNGTLEDMTVSGGWTLLTSATGAGGSWPGTKIWRRIAAAEPASYTLGQGASADGVAVIVAIADAAATGHVVASASSASQDIFIPTPAATPPAIGCVELRWAAGVRNGGATVDWGVPAGYEELEVLQSRTFATGALAGRTLTSNAPVAQQDFLTTVGLSTYQGFTILVRPPTGGGGGGGGGGETPPPTSPPPTIPAIPSSEQVVHYRYYFCDLLTDDLIANDLDLKEVSYDRRIGEAGSFSAEMDITDDVTAAKVARIVPRHPDDLTTGPGRTIVHVYRNGVVWGSYVIWRASVGRSGRDQPISVRIEGASLESYLAQVKIRADLGPYTGVDQVQIARNLLDAMQSTTRYNIGLVLQSGVTSVIRDRTYLASESSTFGDRLAELAGVTDGFEWAIQVVDNGDGTRTRYWLWGYPKLGSESAGHKFAEPGNVLSWSEDIDPLRGGTAFQTRGETISTDLSESSAPLTSSVVLAQAHIDAGWPGLDVTTDYSGVSQQETLDDYAAWWAANRGGAVRVHQATVRLPANTTFGPGALGDTVTIMLVNPWWPITSGVASFAKSWRVVGMTFKPPSKGSGQEECTLVFEEAAEEA